MIDTLGMARAWLAAYLRRLSLAAVSSHYGIGVKGDTVYKVMGMSRAQIKAAGLFEAYKAYCLTDSDLCWGIYRKMIDEGFPASEIAVMDTVLRACVKPAFVPNKLLLAEHLFATLQEKENMLQRAGLTSRDDLMSNDKFAAALERFGVTPPRKISPVTGKETWAFAKTDPEFLDLEEHEDPRVQIMVAARLGVKSTIEETRTQRLINVANLTWPSNSVPSHLQGLSLLPMPLKYSGAHTHRLGGEWKLNMQNLPTRGNNKIRMALEAPPRHKVVAVDSSQVEARGVSSFCKCESMRAAFDRGEDIYSLFASDIFGRTITKANKPQRFVGKQAILGLGYGLGWLTFQKRVAMDSLAQTGEEIILDDVEAGKVVTTYRTKYQEVPAVWRVLEGFIAQMTNKDCRVEYGPVVFLHEKIRLPNGLYLYYHKLRFEGGSWKFEYNGKTKYIYGGKLLENIIQALARIIIMDCAVRVRKSLGISFNLQVHDELVYIVHEDVADQVMGALIEEMRVRPSWDPLWPLDAEGDVAPSYGAAK
jgi:DNA polymerase